MSDLQKFLDNYDDVLKAKGDTGDHVSHKEHALSTALSSGGIHGDEKRIVLAKELVQSNRRAENVKDSSDKNKKTIDTIDAMMCMNAKLGEMSECKRCGESVIFGGKCCGQYWMLKK
jgi:hypothetical protein